MKKFKHTDYLDELILQKIQEDSKITHKELAHELNVSTKPIFDRIKKFERNGIIKNSVSLLNEKKINKSLIAFCTISLKSLVKADLLEFQSKIDCIDEIMEIYQTAGSDDYLIKVIVEDIDEFQELLSNKLFEISNINGIKTSFVTQTVKHTTQIKNIKYYSEELQ